jgi:5-methylcytosine-specific restriction endonuclease McrA
MIRTLHNPEVATRGCPVCLVTLPNDCFRKGANACVWCTFSSMDKRATARYREKRRMVPHRLALSMEEFLAWYCAQPDSCAYCGLTFSELKELRIRRRGGYWVAWDIDRLDSSRLYEPGNLALSCFVCNTAKGDILSAAEACVIGAAVRGIWDKRLAEVRQRPRP